MAGTGEQALADHGGPHDPDTIVVGERERCPDGHICLSGAEAREFARQLAEIAAQSAMIAR